MLQVCYRCFTCALQVCDRCLTLVLQVFYRCFTGVLQGCVTCVLQVFYRYVTVFHRCVCGNSLVCVQKERRGDEAIGYPIRQRAPHEVGICYRCFTGVLQVFYRCVSGVRH